jgi:hypothetical protein
VLRVQNDVSQDSGPGRTTKDYIDWLEASGQISQAEAEHWRILDVMAPVMKDTFHLTPQAAFPSVRIDGRAVRADALIWVPTRPSVRYVLECDGYEWHSDKGAFTADRKRDRALSAEGYSILRFSGHEIYHDPAGAATELFERLQQIGSSWEPPAEQTQPDET